MNDPAKECRKKSEQVADECLGARGVILGCQMFNDYRAKIIASLPKDLAKDEFGKRLFERIYGAPMEDFLSGRITDADLER